ncbi:hypothetical protein CMI46_01525 [Candidatus Pacearchaeota archaeon]|nr:hypothetical protein [Candidatus Pacearchaeota archaeon]|tara:strand:- start:10464 stop:11141 length:678 start_codon:yes stop_codon:yes gene_type:complete
MGLIGDSVDTVFQETVVKWVNFFSNAIPAPYDTYINLGLAIIAVTLYAIFVWKFYRFLAKRDLLELNLAQYNNSVNPGFFKFLAVILFIIEFIIILPIIVFFWFFVMAVIIFVLLGDRIITADVTAGYILFIAAVIVGAVRIASYYSEDLSKDLAKMFPFTILAIALVSPGFFKKETVSALGEIGSLMGNIFVYLIVIIVLEFILRMLYLVSPKKEEFGEQLTSE